MIPAAIESNYPKCLLRAGWWQMGLFQRSVDGWQGRDGIPFPGDQMQRVGAGRIHVVG